MRLLHTADWHVGRTIRGFVRLREAGIPVLVIPGNHDSAVRFEALGKLLGPLGTHVVPRVLPPERGGALEVPSRDGAERAIVVCVPFVPERRFGDAAALFEATESWFQSYAQGMGELIAAMATAFRPDAVNVLMGHLFTDGALLGKGERELTIGMAYAISPGRLPGTAAYCALGHVHRPQKVRGAPAPTRYAGSLLQLDFGEAEQAKSVTIVDASPGAPAEVREIGLTAGRSLLDLRGTLDEVTAMEEEVGDAFLRVFVRTDGPVPGIADRVREALPNALDVQLDYERAEATGSGEPVASLQPREQFAAYFRAHHAAEPSEELLGAFDEVLELDAEDA
ncbi:MAG: exonuclease SbcCD subunit D C-terminal domain-containing protein [Actinobacteria bacterium]|nr:exonuclease SbcCD subunit D C-terminal domain-containing protein [Actinomycetota bacterium]